ncbi:MAG: hypothetical protein LAP39_03335 [Acidobacteriia bacterium]|nr:hypothetical protein [Terriglobia bacterium]
MLYDSTKILLQSILRSLEKVDEAEWDDLNESGKQCLYEMHAMSKPLYKGYRTEGPKGRAAVLAPVFENAHRAIPHGKAMVHAIRRKDRAAALESGRAAIAEMNGTAVSRSPVHSAEPKVESKEVSNVLRQHKKPAGQHRPVAKERRPSRRSFVASSN